MNKDFSKLCTPAKIYFAIAVISSLIALLNGIKIVVVFFKILFAFIWTYFLSVLCEKGYKKVSWFLVLLPYILIFLAVLGLLHVSKSQKQMLNSIQLQGAFGRENFTSGFTTEVKPTSSDTAKATPHKKSKQTK
jgi:hypothetical protein